MFILNPMQTAEENGGNQNINQVYSRSIVSGTPTHVFKTAVIIVLAPQNKIALMASETAHN